MNSYTEENYLKAIYKLLEQDNLKVTTNSIAERMNVKASSVTDMLKKLADKKLINYEKYQGVTLTEKGRKTAVGVIRKHRLWEVFLVEKLNFKWNEVHDIAEQLEHIGANQLTERLDKFLGHPKVDPHGDPIPDINGTIQSQDSKLLSQLKKGNTGLVTGVVDHSASFLQYLDKIGIGIGTIIKIEDITDYDKSLKAAIDRKKGIYISHEVAKNILIILNSE